MNPTEVRIELFDGLRVVSQGRKLEFTRRQTGLLLAHLGLGLGRSLSREELICLLWPDDDAATSRQRLRQRLHVLKSTLDRWVPGAGAVVVSDAEEVRLDSAVCSSDWGDFAESMRKGRSALEPDQARESFRNAVGLAQGPLLRGFYHDSVASARMHADDELQVALNWLVKDALSSNELDHVAEDCRRLLALDELSEQSHLLSMRAWGRLGRSSAVERQCAQWKRLAKDDLGLEPSLEFVEGYELALSESRQAPKLNKPSPLVKTESLLPKPVSDLVPLTASQPTSRRRPHSGWLALSVLLILSIAVAVLLANSRSGTPVPSASKVDFGKGWTSDRDLSVHFGQAYGKGFKGPRIENGVLVLSDGFTGISSSVWWRQRVNTRVFTSKFRFRAKNPPGNPGGLADGFAFVLQDDGLDALGAGGMDLGCGGIVQSAAVFFDFYAPEAAHGPKGIYWGVSLNGASPIAGRFADVDFEIDAEFEVTVTYDGEHTVQMHMRNLKSQKSDTIELKRRINSLFPDGLAYVGFTAGTGMGWSRVEILDWEFISGQLPQK